MTLVSVIGSLAALLTTAAFVPQAYKTIRYRATEALSLATFSMLLFGTVLWFIYGYYLDNLPIMLANAVTGSLAGLILGMKLQAVYRARRHA